MDTYMYQAALYCEDCGEEIKSRLKAPPNPDDEYTFDSDDYPKGPYPDGGGEADCPQHCGNCSVFLENSLTDYGIEYVREAHNERPSDITRLWMDFYGIEESDESD